MSNQAQAGRAPAPFDMTTSPNVPELLRQLDITLALSTYQAGKVVLVSAVDDETITQLPRTFPRAMAMEAHEKRLAIATAGSVEVLVNDPRLAQSYPKQPGVYDAFFAPRVSYYTGPVDCHSLRWNGDDQLIMVNTRLNAICTLSTDYGFVPTWKPPFISEFRPEDRAHLNGMAMKDGHPEYVTCLGTGDTAEAWKQTIPGGGVVVHVPTGEVVAGDLQMPHSPILLKGALILLLSATGEVIRMEPETGAYQVMQQIPGFVRGMAYWRDHLFVAVSKIRKNSSSFRKLEIADTSNEAGIWIIHEPSGSLVGRLTYHQSVDEIFDVVALPGVRRPGITNSTSELARRSLSFPEGAAWSGTPQGPAVVPGHDSSQE